MLLFVKENTLVEIGPYLDPHLMYIWYRILF